MKRILCYGDSNTWGFTPGSGKRYPSDVRWTGVMAKELGKDYEVIAKKIGLELHRGSTFLDGQGAYSGQETKVILTAVKKQQIAELKQLVVEVDPDAFIIVQEAHQVLGDGFARYSKFNL